MLFFFFKQNAAYEMRISDWSSDVCSSDLEAYRRGAQHQVRIQTRLGLRHAPMHEQRRDIVDETMLVLAQRRLWLLCYIRHLPNMMNFRCHGKLAFAIASGTSHRNQ